MRGQRANSPHSFPSSEPGSDSYSDEFEDSELSKKNFLPQIPRSQIQKTRLLKNQPDVDSG